MDYIDRVLAREERLRADFEAKIYADCEFCKEPILYGEDYYDDGYDRMCERCMDKFESKEHKKDHWKRTISSSQIKNNQLNYNTSGGIMADLAIYEANGKEIQLSKDTVKQYLVSGNGKVSDQEVVMFMELCKYQELNPFLKEAYLIKYSDRAPASIVVGKEAYMKRAQAQPDYERFEAGIIIQRNNQLMEVEGSFKLPQDALLGGWAKIYRKGIKVPNITRVSMTEYSQGQSTWAKMPATMIRKVAIVQAIRETYPEQFGGMYIEEEINKEPITIVEEPVRQEKNLTNKANKKILPGQNEEPEEEDDEEIIIEAEVEAVEEEIIIEAEVEAVEEEIDQDLIDKRNELYKAVEEKKLSYEVVSKLIKANYKKENSSDLDIEELEDLISVIRIYEE